MHFLLMRLFGAKSKWLSKAGASVLSLFDKAVADLQKLQDYAKKDEVEHLAEAVKHTEEATTLNKLAATYGAVADKIKTLVTP